MKIRENPLLLTPGPVKVPDEILNAQTEPMITHRCPEMSDLYSDIVERFKRYTNAFESHIITGSGTAGLETLLSNLISPESKALFLTNGVFGEKFANGCRVYASSVDERKMDAGMGWNIDRAEEIIENSDADVFGIVYNETGYGVRNRIREICRKANDCGMIVLVDAISAWPGTEFDMKDFRVDGFVTGSQKGPACPPGLALVSLSERAVEISERCPPRSYYFNLSGFRKRYAKSRQTPTTPAITLMRSLKMSFDLLDKMGGVPASVERHRELSSYVRIRIRELGMEIIPENGFESVTLTAFKHEKAKEIRKRLKEEYNIWIASCKGAFSENGLRISNMGFVEKSELDECFDAIENIIKRF